MTALDGIRVLDLTRLLPGAVATQILRDYGAEVVKVEPPGSGDYARSLLSGGGSNPMFEATNRGKKSVVLDLKSEAGREALLRMSESADVLVEGFRPGVMERLQLGWDVLHARNPRLIFATLTGYGQGGAYRDLAGHDLNYLALAGVLDLIGAKDGPPAIPGVQIADIAGGSLQAVIGILLALHARQRTGEGQRVDVSMKDGLAALLTIPLALGSRPRGDDTLSGRYACYNLYRCSDGRWLTVAALEGRFWRNLCEALGVEELVAGQFAPAQDEAKQKLAAIFATRPAAVWFEQLGPKDCCVAPVLSVAEAGTFEDCPRLSATPARKDGRAPELGEHQNS